MDDTKKDEQDQQDGQDGQDGQVSELAPSGDAPDEISSGVAVLNLPPMQGLPPFMTGKPIVSVSLSCVGDSDAGGRLVEPLRHAAPLLADTVADIPYTEFGQISTEPTDPTPAASRRSCTAAVPSSCPCPPLSGTA